MLDDAMVMVIGTLDALVLEDLILTEVAEKSVGKPAFVTDLSRALGCRC